MKEYDNLREVFDEFCSTRLEIYGKRKEHILKKMRDDVDVLKNKTRFISEIIEETLLLKNRKISEISEEMASSDYMKKDGSFEYLFSMRQDAITKEKVETNRASLHKLEQSIKELEAKTPNDLWRADLDKLEASLKKANIL